MQLKFIGVKRPDILAEQQKTKKATQERTDYAMDVDSDESEEEPAGDDVFSDANEESEDEEEASRQTEGRQLPKSASGKVKTSRGRNERVMPPEECRAHLRRLFANEPVICSLLYGRHGPFAPLTRQNLSLASADMFFLDVLPISPTRFRPPAKMGDMLFEHPQNELLARVLTTSYRLRDFTENLRAASQKDSEVDEAGKKRILQSLLDGLIQLQVDVNSFIDSSKNPAPVRQGKLPPAGVKQGLEKKEGLFRKHMMVRSPCTGVPGVHPHICDNRASVSITPRGRSSPRMSTLSQTRLGSHPSSLGSLLFLSLLRPLISMSYGNMLSPDLMGTRVLQWSNMRMDICNSLSVRFNVSVLLRLLNEWILGQTEHRTTDCDRQPAPDTPRRIFGLYWSRRPLHARACSQQEGVQAFT